MAALRRLGDERRPPSGLDPVSPDEEEQEVEAVDLRDRPGLCGWTKAGPQRGQVARLIDGKSSRNQRAKG